MLESRITEIKKFVEFPRENGLRMFVDIDTIATVQGDDVETIIYTLDSQIPFSVKSPVLEVMKIIEDARKIYIHDLKEKENE
nr:MAG TPA: Flagellar and Swarming motility protein [Caudoviricetes sp.]